MGALITLVTGAGVNTSLANQSQLENNLLIGDVDTTNPLQGLKVQKGGRTTIDIQLAVFVNVFAKFMKQLTGSVVGLVLKIATGRLNVSGSSITFTNAGATTPVVYGWSDSNNGVEIEAETLGINVLGNQTFDRFAGLFITPIANIGSFDITMKDGTTNNISVVEADAMFALLNPTEANGRLDSAVTGFDNRTGYLRSVKVNANSTAGGLTVMVIK